MEKEYKLGSIYGSRISKNGKWLNLTIVTEVNGEKRFIVCPVRLTDDLKHPFAFTEHDAEGATRATICHIAVYEDSTPKQEEPADEDIPF